MKKKIRILLFAKAPVAGEVKTRLIPYLSAQRAAKLYQLLLNTVVDNISTVGLPIDIWRAGDLTHTCWQQYAQNPLINLFEQQGADLGTRMEHAARQALKDCDQIILVGADCIEIDKNYLISTITSLQNNDAVIGPASDGGYVLLGLQTVASELFTDITWGGDDVFRQTIAKLKTLSWTYELLAPLNDIDRPEDLVNLGSIGGW